MAFFVIVMGVSGSGKSSVGQALAERLNCPFYDGDDFHPPENIIKMAAGIPLSDGDRRPWLERLQVLIETHLSDEQTGVLACSALKKRYRDQLRSDQKNVFFVYLRGDFELIRTRIESRQAHYMSVDMLQSQFDVLEAPDADEALTIDIDQPIKQIVDQIINLIPRDC